MPSASLTGAHPELRKHLFTEEGKLRAFVNLYLNDEDIRYLPEKEATSVTADRHALHHPLHRRWVLAAPGGRAFGARCNYDESNESTTTRIETMATTTSPDTLPELTTDDLSRYSRHLILPEVGMEGQQRLKAARVLCVGTGGLGSPLALYLAAAGIGTLGLVDFDVVDASNLQRQIIHSTKDIGRKKLDSAEEKLLALNPALNVVKHETMLSSANALDILKDYDIVADGTDNFPTRYLVNDACVLLGKPNVYGSIFRFEGQASVFATEAGPMLPLPLSRAAAAGPGAQLRRGRRARHPARTGRRDSGDRGIKLILGKGESLVGRLLLVDALNMRFRELKLRKNPECPVCGTNPTVTKLIDYQQFCGIVPETKEEKALKNGIPQLSVKELKRRMDAGEDVFILDVREPYEYQIANIGGKLIPQNDVPQRLAEIDRDREIVVQCRSGARSQRIAEFLVAGRLSQSRRIWPAASWPGPTRSTRRCRSTERCANLN